MPVSSPTNTHHPCPSSINCNFLFNDDSLFKHKYCSLLKNVRKLMRKDLICTCRDAQDFSLPMKGAFSVIHQNVRSLDNSMNDLRHFIDNLKLKNGSTPQILGITETWLQDNDLIKLKRYEIPNYSPEHNARANGMRGGVALYIRNDVDYVRRTDISVTHSESLWIEIKMRKKEKPVLIGVIYSSPCGRSEQAFCDAMAETLEQISLEGKNCLILGDWNIDTFKLKISHAYCQAVISNGFRNVIAFPTRVSEQTETSIDHGLVNFADLPEPITAGVIKNDISDHEMTFACLPLTTPLKHKSPIKVFSFKNYHRDNVIADLAHIDWEPVTSELDATKAFDKFVEKILPIHGKHIPIVELKPKNLFKQPWMTMGIHNSQKRRYKLYKAYKRKPTTANKSKYVEYRNKLRSTMRQAEKQYYLNLITDANGDQSKTWHVINDLIGKGKKNVGIPLTLCNGKGDELTDPTAVCQEMNSFFTNIGNELAKKIPDTAVDPLEYVQGNKSGNSFFLKPVTPQEVFSKLSKINVSKSCGADMIHPRFINDASTFIVVPLVHIINCSFSTAKFPDQLKLARVTPIHKSGDKSKSTNYRPVSLLSNFAKVIESLVYDRLYEYVKNNELLSKDQYGFQKNKSTLTALLELTDQIQHNLDTRNQTFALFLDLKKAFDTVQHSILLGKLEKYGIRGVALDWFRSYLHNRKQFVQSGNFQSEALTILSGVPQGSNLGPLLFLLYINDLPNCTKHLSMMLFADDTTAYLSASKNVDIGLLVNSDLKRIETWLTANKLSLNLSKTHGCHFKPPITQDITTPRLK